MKSENFKEILISKAELPKSIQIYFTEIIVFNVGRECILMFNGMWNEASKKSVQGLRCPMPAGAAV